MAAPRTQYPDNSEILARKTAGRRELARKTFAEKLRILEELRDRVAPIAQARKARTQTPLAASAPRRP
ncbi:MAG: hypothetical protein ABSD74_19680 [Rhizomicrobium sp.]